MKKLFLWGIIISSIIVTATVLMIYVARGYRIVNNELVTTAILKIDSDPRGAKIIIDGKEVGSTVKDVSGILEGDHEIEVVKEGFIPWKKSIYVESGTVRELSIKLLPVELNLEQITQTNIDQLFFSDDGKSAIFTVTDNRFDTGIWIARFDKSFFEKELSKFADISIIPTAQSKSSDYSFTISPDNKAAVMRLGSADKPIFYLFEDLELKYTALPTSLNTRLGFDPQGVLWHEDSSKLLLYEENLLFSYDLQTDTSQLLSYTDDSRPLVFSKNIDDNVLTVKKIGSNTSSTDNNQHTITFELFKPSNSHEVFEATVTSQKSPVVDYLFLTDADEPAFFFSVNNHLYYYNSELDIMRDLSTFSSIIAMSPQGTGAIVEKGGKVVSIALIIDLPHNSIIAKKTGLGDYADSLHLQFYSFNDAILEYDSEGKTFSIYDIDGGNKHIFFDDLDIQPPQGWISDETTQSVILTVAEELSAANGENAGNKNFYRLVLK